MSKKMITIRSDPKSVRLIEEEHQRLVAQSEGCFVTKSDAIRSLFVRASAIKEKVEAQADA